MKNLTFLGALMCAAFAFMAPAHAQGFNSAPVPNSITTKYGETRAYFRDWLAVCKPGEDACRAVGYAGKVGHVGDYQFYVRSGTVGLDYQMQFVPIAVMADTSMPMEIIIDGESLGTFEFGADDGYYREGNVVNEFTFGQSRSNLDMLPAMQAGSSMVVRFTDENGETGNVQFSLFGLTNALRWMDAYRQSD
ncbi:hypothetical protein BN1012_Phect1883 [Candidatus Phaeomarinobacter ectocarpi]|uniref:Uncharacterized protein n=1 Tax=Candidatus Phaeomarinibacter ectocarpi TaxID=1458461 RepID=X5MNG0_9HYPH|nr:hypothetical protein [Candidatus Phaeomarinobacter ectocarpi]CDO60096.1 hypothetical protein BN1012_Phect1883 [Candidatus Phaeomarinobacter ectocarpi]